MESENRNYFERLGQSIRSSVTLKLLSIFILMLLLLIPMSYVESVIQERESLQQQSVSEVSSKWANEQYVYGPVLTIPIQRKFTEEGKEKIVREAAHILPGKLKINGKVEPKSLHRGIYEVVVYDSELAFSGQFDKIAEYLKELEAYDVFLDEAFLTIHISDLRGIKEKVAFKWNGQERDVDPGSNIPYLIPSGVSVQHVLDTLLDKGHSFEFQLQLQGSQHLGFIPLGTETEVVVTSDWQDPSFSGSFLPDHRKVDKNGFSAEWKVLELNRNYPQFFIGNRDMEELKKSAFGVDLLLPTNDYLKSIRSAKYALLTISLTFLTFFLVEVFNKRKVHPFQYILIGLALILFYTLLVSISEHTHFDIAYLISSISIIGMIALYARSILRSGRQTAGLVLILCFTYTFVYVTLQVQDYALLIGSIGLAVILGFTMYITRKINWYEISSGKNPNSPESR